MRVIEIFESIDGEVNHWGQGTLTTFVRFAGCNMQCYYCDTKKSQDPKGGKKMSVESIVNSIRTTRVTITGGEPLIQLEKEMCELVGILANNHKKISLETNGSIEIPSYFFNRNYQISVVMDYKFEQDKIAFGNLRMMSSRDWVKFPITDIAQFDRITDIVKVIRTFSPVRIAFSPIGVKPTDLVAWMKEGFGMDYVALNIQIHKVLDLR